MAAMCLAALAGPTEFAGWDAGGRPLGRVRNGAWVVIAGVSEAGTKPIMMSLHALLVGSPLMADPRFDLGLTRVRYGAGLIQLATAGAASLEGIRPTLVVADELGHWKPSNHGHDLYEVLMRGCAKVPRSLFVDASNAHSPGEDSVGERLADAAADMADDDPESVDVVYDEESAPADLDITDLPAVRGCLEWLYRDSPWVDIDQLLSLLLDAASRPEEWKRFYLNLSHSDSSKWTKVEYLDTCGVADIRPLTPGDRVSLGIDPAMKRDSTALVAVRIDDGAQFLLWLGAAPLDVDGLNKAVDEAFANYHVVALLSDVHGGEPLLPLWRSKYAAQLGVKASQHDPVAYDHRANVKWVVREGERLRAEIEAGTFAYLAGDPGWPMLRRHILAAIAVEIPQGVHFAKPARGSQYKVDALAALINARIGRTLYLSRSQR
jgi:phage terminase large subunit-like protein